MCVTIFSSLSLIHAVLATKLFLCCTGPFDTPILLNGTSFVWPPVGLVFLLDRGLGPARALCHCILGGWCCGSCRNSPDQPPPIVCGDCTVKSNGGGGSTLKSMCWRSVLPCAWKMGDLQSHFYISIAFQWWVRLLKDKRP